MTLQNKTLGVLFTRGISLATWDKLGSLEREIKIYIALAKEYKQIYFFTYGIDEEKKYSHLLPDNVHIISRPRYIPSILYSIYMPLIHWYLFSKIDIIKTNQMDGAYAAILAQVFSRAKVISRSGYEWLEYLERTHASMWKRIIAYCVEKFVYKYADKIVISSLESKNFIIKKFGTDARKIEVIPNYVDTVRFASASVEKIPGRVIFVGQLEHMKNLANLVEAMKGLDAHLVLVGVGSQKDMLQELAQKHSVKVEFLGRVAQKDLPAELVKSEIFVLPSLSEGNPKALLEAMSTGLACLASDVAGNNSIIINGQNGQLCDIGVKSIHDSLEYILSNSFERKRLGEAARLDMQSGYSFEKVFQEELALHSTLINPGV